MMNDLDSILDSMSNKSGYKPQASTDDEPPLKKVKMIEQQSKIWNPTVCMEIDPKWTTTTSKPWDRVTPAMEVRRQKCARALQKKLDHFVNQMGLPPLPNSAYECWQFGLRLEEGLHNISRERDFFIAAGHSDHGNSKATSLRDELIKVGASGKSASKVCKLMRIAAAKASSALVRQNIGPGKKNVQIKTPEGSSVQVSYQDVSLQVNIEHFEKLKALYNASTNNSLKDFPSFLFCLLCRYDSLQGGGFQAAIHEECFDVLLKHFDCKMECFASPLNCRYQTFCSAFPDTDTPFGSLGSFFDFYPKTGVYEANPPFMPQMIFQMASHMASLLSNTREPLMFIIIIPEWSDTKAWQTLRKSQFLKDYMKIDQKDHGYTEGKQQMRPTRWRIASFNTSVFFWQNPAAEKKYLITDDIKNELQEAFKSKQETERVESGLSIGGKRVRKSRSTY